MKNTSSKSYVQGYSTANRSPAIIAAEMPPATGSVTSQASTMLRNMDQSTFSRARNRPTNTTEPTCGWDTPYVQSINTNSVFTLGGTASETGTGTDIRTNRGEIYGIFTLSGNGTETGMGPRPQHWGTIGLTRCPGSMWKLQNSCIQRICSQFLSQSQFYPVSIYHNVVRSYLFVCVSAGCWFAVRCMTSCCLSSRRRQTPNGVTGLI